MRYPVTFTNRSGLQLVGTVTLPDSAAPAEWPALVVCLCTAINPRHVNRALKREMSRGFNRLGIPVLNFDFPGVGDSEGELRENSLFEVYRQIEKGCFAGDVLDAIRFARECFPVRRVLVTGNCGGAITALHAAALDPEITDLVLMSLPVTLSIVPGEDSFDSNLARFQLGDYIKQLRHFRGWRKLLSRETHYDRIWSALTCFVRSRYGGDRICEDTEDGLSASFLSSFDEVNRRGTGVLCFFGEHDRGPLRQYDELFRARYGEYDGEPSPNWKTVVIGDASHDFYTPAARAALWNALQSFLRDRGIVPREFPVRTTPEQFRNAVAVFF